LDERRTLGQPLASPAHLRGPKHLWEGSCSSERDRRALCTCWVKRDRMNSLGQRDPRFRAWTPQIPRKQIRDHEPRLPPATRQHALGPTSVFGLKKAQRSATSSEGSIQGVRKLTSVSLRQGHEVLERGHPGCHGCSRELFGELDDQSTARERKRGPIAGSTQTPTSAPVAPHRVRSGRGWASGSDCGLSMCSEGIIDIKASAEMTSDAQGTTCGR
jgi:hypothetical protein